MFEQPGPEGKEKSVISCIPVCFAVLRDIPGDLIYKALFGETPPRGLTPHPTLVYTTFDRRGAHYRYLLLTNSVPLTYPLKTIFV